MTIEPIMWLKEPNKLCLTEDLGEYIHEMGFDWDEELSESQFVELWELILEWQKDVQK